MRRGVKVEAGKPVFAGIEVIDHIAVTSLDLWDDEDANGRPDRFLRRIKNPNQAENELVEIGAAEALIGKVLQWIWMPSQPPDSTDDWIVRLRVEQGGKALPNFPLRLQGSYPSGQTTGIFQTWIRFERP
jgi:hypothetical protein